MTLIDPLLDIVNRASSAILKIYNTDFAVEYKDDDSPVTEADRVADRIIHQELMTHFPDIPILSEETTAASFAERSNWNNLWIVDPLDGTRRFEDRTGQFTVNIALVEAGQPVVGIVGWPVEDIVYFGDTRANQAFRIAEGECKEITTTPVDPNYLRVAISQRRMTETTKRLLALLKQDYPNLDLVERSSSLKLCSIAEGASDLYPQYGGTSEWDIAAGHAVLKAAGGDVRLMNGDQLLYNQSESLLNDQFVAFGDISEAWIDYLFQVLTTNQARSSDKR